SPWGVLQAKNNSSVDGIQAEGSNSSSKDFYRVTYRFKAHLLVRQGRPKKGIKTEDPLPSSKEVWG
ncbi:hypothetical protein SK128_018812, partial [Halocaridina rubra]